jgi:hypothetical protein
MQSKGDSLQQSKSASALLLNRLIPENNSLSNTYGSNTNTGINTGTLKPRMMLGSKSTPFLPPVPGDEQPKPNVSVVDKVRAIRGQGNRSLSNSASATLLSENPQMRTKDLSTTGASEFSHTDNFGFSRNGFDNTNTTNQKITLSTDKLSPTNMLLTTALNMTSIQVKNSFISSLNMSPQHLHDLFKVPHTFFYLSVRQAGSSEQRKKMENQTQLDATSGDQTETESRGNSGSVYDLEVVSLDKVDKNYYFTLSKEGVTQFRGKVSQFTGLAQWEREFKLFHRIAGINFFKVYKRWKVGKYLYFTFHALYIFYILGVHRLAQRSAIWQDANCSEAH